MRRSRAYDSRKIEAQVHSFVDDMPAVYADAKFAITCAGAVTLAELATAGLPALLVPLSSAASKGACDARCARPERDAYPEYWPFEGVRFSGR